MRVLLVDGFARAEPNQALDQIEGWLVAGGHQVRRFELAANGFDAFMSAAEREAYETDTPLITADTRAAADAVLAAEAVVICYPVVHGTAPPRVKSWQERVFVLGLAFRFAPSGRITGALDHLHRALVVGVSDGPVGAGRRWPSPARWRDPVSGRNSFGPCLARSFFLSSNRRCRSRYLTIDATTGDQARAAISRW
jgi:putative NADPH-quinone reductase